jgi:hypothetical protein
LGIPANAVRSSRVTVAIGAASVIACWCGGAQAFRPFDGTDAAVADTGKVEIEFGPAEYLREGTARTLLAPSTRINYGFAPDWEAVVEGRVAHGLSGDLRGTGLVEDGASLKRVLREGVLQDKPGPSITTEFGVLLPGVRADRGAGATLAGIVSQRWEGLTFHLNAAASLTREQHADLFLSTILEGPHDWAVRPVAEVVYDRDFGRAEVKSALVGAIWRVRDNLAFDVGFRGGRVNDHTVAELRAGLTFSFAVEPAPSGKTEGGGR